MGTDFKKILSLEFNAKTGRYHDANSKRFVKNSFVMDSLDAHLQKSKREIRAANHQLKSGKMDLVEWRSEMVEKIRTAHTVHYVIGKGGFANMDDKDYTRLETVIKKQFRFLNRFVSDMQSKFESPKELDSRFDTRAQMYMDAAHPTYQNARRLERFDAGSREERRRLGVAEHCDECIEAAEQGWQPIYTLPPIGSLRCNVGCKCSMEYR